MNVYIAINCQINFQREVLRVEIARNFCLLWVQNTPRIFTTNQVRIHGNMETPTMSELNHENVTLDWGSEPLDSRGQPRPWNSVFRILQRPWRGRYQTDTAVWSWVSEV